MNKPRYEHLKRIEVHPSSKKAPEESGASKGTTTSESLSSRSAASSSVSLHTQTKRVPTSIQTAPSSFGNMGDTQAVINSSKAAGVSRTTL
jgi:hypothetical protein